MSQRWIAASGLVGALVLAGCATGGGSGTEAAVARPSVEVADARTVTATVEAIDLQTRLVTLRGEDGRSMMIHAPDEVRNLAQVRPGDRVTATYYEAAAVQVLAPGEATPGVGAASSMKRAEPGERPAGTVAETMRVTSTVEKIDRDARQVTLRMPDGTTDVVNVRDPAKLEGVTEGDLVQIDYMRAVSIKVEGPAK
jgi:Cu/Ag efflux protein CusF